MLRRSRTREVDCRFGGDHAAFSPRLRLQAARYSDAVNECLLGQDEAAQYWLGWGPDAEHDHRLPEGLDPLMLSMAAMRFKAVDDRAHRLVGFFGLTRCPDGVYEVDYLVHAALRGQGYGREALEALCRLAHHHFGMAALRAWCEPANIGSVRCLQANGFVQDGPPRELRMLNGRETHLLPWRRVDPTARWRCGNVPDV